MKRVLIAICSVGFVALLWLAYENSTGKEVWNAIQTFVAVIAGLLVALLARGIWSAAMTAAAALAITVGGALLVAPTIEKTESVGTVFLIETSTGRPVFIDLMPYQNDIQGILGVLPNDSWKTYRDGEVYHHLLQRAILQYLVQQQSRRAGKVTTSVCGWDREIWQDRGLSTTLITGDEITRTFAKNQFIGAAFFPVGELVVPKQTRLLGVVPGKESGSSEGVIELRNPFFDLKITTRFNFSSNGVQGRCALFTTGGRAMRDPRFSSEAYLISVSGKSLTMSRPFPYHPDTATYADWTEQIVRDLTCIFGEAGRWRALMDEVTFRHLIGAKQW